MSARVSPQPLIAVTDVGVSSTWYQQLLDATSGHGGPEYEQLLVEGSMVLQLHALEVEHHHARIGNPGRPMGNGVAVWFAVEDLDAALQRIAVHGLTVATPVHVNPNTGHREIWLRDPDGYVVVLAG